MHSWVLGPQINFFRINFCHCTQKCFWDFLNVRNVWWINNIDGRDGSRAATTSKIECFVIIVNVFQPLTIITKHSILDVAAALDPPLDGHLSNHFLNSYILVLSPCGVMCQNCMCFFIKQSYSLIFSYRTSTASSDEMELQSSLDDSLQLQTLYVFHIELYRISCSSGKTRSNASSLCHP